MFRLIFLVCFVVLYYSNGGRAQTSNPQLIGRVADNRGLPNQYVYAWSEPVEVTQVLPIIAATGTPSQQRRARRLLRAHSISTALFGASFVSAASGGFFGEPQLRTRQTVTIAGAGLLLSALGGSLILERRARRLVQAYNDTLLTEADGYVRSYTGNPYLTLADTVALSGNRFSYRGLDDVLPTRTTGFDWKRGKPRLGVVGTIGIGLAAVGGLTLAATSLAALQPGDYRRFAWSGAGLTILPLSVMIPIGNQNRKRQTDVIRRYNQYVRKRGQP